MEEKTSPGVTIFFLFSCRVGRLKVQQWRVLFIRVICLIPLLPVLLSEVYFVSELQKAGNLSVYHLQLDNCKQKRRKIKKSLRPDRIHSFTVCPPNPVHGHGFQQRQWHAGPRNTWLLPASLSCAMTQAAAKCSLSTSVNDSSLPMFLANWRLDTVMNRKELM